MILSTDIFHVHSFRCGHAQHISDEAYITKAIQQGATGIWFTDHAPFPGDPFGNRMAYRELTEYVSTLSDYKSKYAGKIKIHIGLEIEYFPSYQSYYEDLRANRQIELLLLGQHMAEEKRGQYTFDWSSQRLEQEEYSVLGQAISEGIRSGYFGAVAHPDRIFRRRTKWDCDMQKSAMDIINVAKHQGVPLEINVDSMRRSNHYWPQFWEIASGHVKTITGVDAHTVKDI